MPCTIENSRLLTSSKTNIQKHPNHQTREAKQFCHLENSVNEEQVIDALNHNLQNSILHEIG